MMKFEEIKVIWIMKRIKYGWHDKARRKCRRVKRKKQKGYKKLKWIGLSENNDAWNIEEDKENMKENKIKRALKTKWRTKAR